MWTYIDFIVFAPRKNLDEFWGLVHENLKFGTQFLVDNCSEACTS